MGTVMCKCPNYFSVREIWVPDLRFWFNSGAKGQDAGQHNQGVDVFPSVNISLLLEEFFRERLRDRGLST